MIDFPEVIEAQMTADDIAVARVLLKGWQNPLSQSCPVVQVLTRLYPDYRWTVGTDRANAYDPAATEADKYPREREAVATYRLAPDTKLWVAGFDPQGTDAHLPEKVRMTKMAPEMLAHSGQEQG